MKRLLYYSTICFLLILNFLIPSSAFSDAVIMTVTLTAPTPATPPPTPPSSTPAGPGGLAGPPPSFPTLLTEAIFKGNAYPGSPVSLTRDGTIIATTPAGPDASFQIIAGNLHAGTYTFGVSAKDKNGNKSLLQTFTVSITDGASTVVSGIFIAPSISIDNKEIKRGELLTILGQSVPEAKITVFVNSINELTSTISADLDGIWFYKVNTALLEYGDHTTKALAQKGFDVTSLSALLNFKVGTVTIPADKIATPLIGDLNGDGRVNLIDFSIEAYWYKKVLTAEIAKKVDLNHDGRVDLIDFSILAFHWTG